MDFSPKKLLPKKVTTCRSRKLQCYNKLYEKQWLLVLIWNKKHSSKQVVPITYTLEKKFFAAATFEGLVSSFFSDIVKKLIYFGLHESFSHI